MTIVQQIETIWGKESRSSEKAAIRNSVPDAFEAPISEKGKSLHQYIHFDEKTEFKHPTSKISSIDDNRKNHFFDAVRVYFEDDVLKVVYSYSPDQVGAPERSPVPRQVLSLNNGEWGKVVYTGRFCGSYTGYGDWFYRKEVFNIANVSGPHVRIFQETKPKKVFTDIADLR